MKLKKDKNVKACDRFIASNWRWLWSVFFIIIILGLGAQQSKAGYCTSRYYPSTYRLRITLRNMTGDDFNNLEIQCESTDVPGTFTVTDGNSAWSIDGIVQEGDRHFLKLVRVPNGNTSIERLYVYHTADPNKRGTRGRLFITLADEVLNDSTGYSLLKTRRTDLPALIKLDINYVQDNNEPNTEPNFTGFTMEDSGSAVNGVTIDFGGAISTARRAQPTGEWSYGDPCDPNDDVYYPRDYERLYRDLIFGIPPSGIDVTLWGLGQGRECEITIWAFDANSNSAGPRKAIWTANGDYLLTTDFNSTLGAENYPGYDGADCDLYAWPATATADEFGRIKLVSSVDPCSPGGEYFAFLDALVIVPLNTYIPVVKAQRPVPFDEEEEVPIDASLSWIAGAGATSHRVYLGTSESAVDAATTSDPEYQGLETSASHDPYGTSYLRMDQTYYWRIDEMPGPQHGEVWSFTTEAFCKLEDFDSYVDTAALRQVWKDYWTPQASPLTSAEVYWETTTVIDGSSMRYWYRNNSFEPYYSEARATIGSGSGKLHTDPNWLGINAKSLSLLFHGDPLNPNGTHDDMYLNLIDSDSGSATVHYTDYGDINDLQLEEWQEWNIPLDDFSGADLTKVSKVVIGFGDGTQSVIDGNMYFEDIYLYPTRCALVERSAEFALADYAPGGIISGDCVVDSQELQVISNTWLYQEAVVYTKNPNDVNLVKYYPLNTGDGNKVYPDPCDPIWTGTFHNSAVDPPPEDPCFGTKWAKDSVPNIGDGNCVYMSGEGGGRINCGTYGQASLGIGPTPPAINAITLSIWVKWLGPRTWDPYLLSKSQGLMGKRGGWNESGMIWTFWISANPGQEGGVGLGHYSDTSMPDLVSPAGTMDSFIGKWVHLAATFPHPSGDPCDANDYARLYLNGGEVAFGPWRFSHGWDPNIFLTIGQTNDPNAWPNGPASYYGYLDEVRIYNRALEPNEVAYLADMTPEDGKLVIPPASLAEIYTGEPEGFRIINYMDFAIMADKWIEEYMFPYEP